MPVYQYHCQSCGHDFERTERLSQHGRKSPPCPKCKSTKVEQVLTSFFAKTSRKH